MKKVSVKMVGYDKCVYPFRILVMLLRNTDRNMLNYGRKMFHI
jgi:hypothetical protein